ncbi:hypothetical protein EMPS_05794 [Entomortierella parvispora]|uniref:Uncharacterized protein n=1 Tax=Entomortierella parvispora TaxID=205924 RepID=A0A9P3LWM3_9FUNG|nr:hypothetical protein EMPS_05794 [Entomortierella parvispora]
MLERESVDHPADHHPHDKMYHADGSDLSKPSQPSVLSFRTFHATHFSESQRQAFFAGASSGPFHPSWPRSQPAWLHGGEWGAPERTDLEPYNDGETTEHPGDYHPSEVTPEEWDDNDEAVQEDNEGVLSKEAIAIFEFSRRFRQEKALADLKEKNRLKLRRTKRRKLTRLGFALNEGNSDESDSDLSHGQSCNLGDLGEEEEQEEEDEDEDDIPAEELSSTDISFMSLNEKLRERTHQRLYASGSDQANTSEIRSIEMLEDLLNQTYSDSVRRDGVVYWPGMPLRC